jgi:hypothetical protein
MLAADGARSVGLAGAGQLEAVHVEASPPFRRAARSRMTTRQMMLERRRLFITTFAGADVRRCVDGATLGETDIRAPVRRCRDDLAEFRGRGAYGRRRACGSMASRCSIRCTPSVFLRSDAGDGAVFFHRGYRSVSRERRRALSSHASGGGNGGCAALRTSRWRARLERISAWFDFWIRPGRTRYARRPRGSTGRFRSAVRVPRSAGAFRRAVGHRYSLEASGLWEDDRLFGDVEASERTNANGAMRAAGHTELAVRTSGATSASLPFARRDRATPDGRPIPWSGRLLTIVLCTRG